eukprot:Gb_16798 [translate_table: standard]
MIINFLLAGRDTTSSGLTSFGFFCLEESIHKEILHILSQRNAQTDRDAIEIVLSYKELKDMHWLLRLYPPVPIDNKLAIKEDVMFVGKGWFVKCFPYAMGRMESI